MVSNQAPTTLLSRKEGLRKTTQFSRFFFQTTLFVHAHMCEEPRLRNLPIGYANKTLANKALATRQIHPGTHPQIKVEKGRMEGTENTD